MKFKILVTLIIYTFLTCNVFGEPISKSKAITFAESWFNKYDATAKASDVFTVYNDEKVPSFYVVNFSTGGFILVAANDKIHPMLGYSYSGYSKPDSTDKSTMSWFDSYSERIDYVVKNKTEKQNIKTKAKWDKVGSIFQTNFKSTSSGVPSLFETYQTSRWGYWDPYNASTPDGGTGICVPIAVAQICKYWKHPKQGTGSYSYTQIDDEGEPYLNEIDYSEFSYNYDLMPFRLTYCTNGLGPICDDDNSGIIPGTATEQIEEVADLIYHSGLTVEMQWFPDTLPYGTYGYADAWAQQMENHLGFSSEWDYWSTSDIVNDSEGFKEAIRYDLDNERPVLFRYRTSGGAHAVVINGYENNDYFYMAIGRGGSSDGYYYLFTEDDDGVHPPISENGGYFAVVNLKPDCPFSATVNITSDIDSSAGEVFQATSSITMSSII